MSSSPSARPALRTPRPRLPVGPWLAVLGGGLVGSSARVGIGYLVPAASDGPPVATLAVNLVGSLLIGLYLARRERAITARWSLQFWAIGVLGSFTTFSAFSLDVVRLLEDGQLPAALGYSSVSIGGGLLLALVGQRLGAQTR